MLPSIFTEVPIPADPSDAGSLQGVLAWAADAADALDVPVPKPVRRPSRYAPYTGWRALPTWHRYASECRHIGINRLIHGGPPPGPREQRLQDLYPLSWLAHIAASDRLPDLDPEDVERYGDEHDPLTLWAEASRVIEAAEGGHAERRDARRRAEELLPDALTFAGDLLALLRDNAAQVRGRTPVQAGPTVTPVMFTN
jgi:hypothetical protein